MRHRLRERGIVVEHEDANLRRRLPEARDARRAYMRSLRLHHMFWKHVAIRARRRRLDRPGIQIDADGPAMPMP
jgi:hypothetical protein